MTDYLPTDCAIRQLGNLDVLIPARPDGSAGLSATGGQTPAISHRLQVKGDWLTHPSRANLKQKRGAQV